MSLFNKQRVIETKEPQPENKTDIGVSIHVMPKKFQTVSVGRNKARNTGITILASGLIIILMVALLLYFFVFSKKAEPKDPNSSINEVPITIKEEKAPEPKKEEPKAEEVPEIEIIEPAEESAGEEIIEGENTEEEVPADIFEDIVGIDTDTDGLTDKEELLLGSDAAAADSDGDGFIDLAELMNLYDPAGPNKLIDSGRFLYFENNNFGYKVLYPTDLTLERLQNDSSVIYQIGDGHFIQIVATENTEKLTVEDWFKKQFDLIEIPAEQQAMTGEKGVLIRTEDGLTSYFSDNKQEYIFSLTYNPGAGNISEYKNFAGFISRTWEWLE